MKRIFTCLFAMILVGATALTGQVIYENNFNDQDWKGITTIATDATPAPNVAGIGPAWSLLDSEGGFVAASTSWFQPVGQADAWMILPRLEIPEEGLELFWEAQAVDGSYPDGYQVWASTTGNEKEDFDVLLFEIGAEMTSWQERSVGLDDFVGDSVHLAFRNNSNDMFVLFINNLVVGSRLENDVRLVAGSDDTRLPGLSLGVALRGERHIEMSVRNRGLSTIEQLEVQYTFNNESWTEVYEGLEISPDDTYRFQNDQALELVVGDAQSLQIEITGMNGVVPDNDIDRSLSAQFDVWPPVPDFRATDSKGDFHSIHEDLEAGRIVVLDFLASWCPPCEFSVPALDAFYQEFNEEEEHPLNVYGMTIEPNDNTDELMNDLADLWGGTYPKFKYTGIINRQQFAHYAFNHEISPQGGIPTFVMVCPNLENIEESEITVAAVGFNASQSPDVFQATFKPAYLDCVESLISNVAEELKSVESVNVFPNPANDLVNISLELEQRETLTIEIFNVLGQKIETISANANMGPGTHSLQWQPNSAGTYFVVISDGKSQMAERVTVVD